MRVHEGPVGRSGPDIVGMGALNVDHIVTVAHLDSETKERVVESSSRFEWNRENRVEKQEILDALDRLHDGSWDVSAQLGGSAWLTIRTLAEMAAGIRLGYVGVMGERLPLRLSFVRAMDALGVDHTWVDVREDEESGICLSYAEDSDRALEIYPGANVRMGDHLRAHREAIAGYLASARFVHVTSFLDDATPSEVAEVLELAKSGAR